LPLQSELISCCFDTPFGHESIYARGNIRSEIRQKKGGRNFFLTIQIDASKSSPMRLKGENIVIVDAGTL
jgi:hypothetical protein